MKTYSEYGIPNPVFNDAAYGQASTGGFKRVMPPSGQLRKYLGFVATK